MTTSTLRLSLPHTGFVLNTGKAPFNDRKIRRAFNLALNRQEIVEHITQGGQIPALAIVLPALGLRSPRYFEDNDVTNAQALFEEGLKEIGLDRKKTFSVTLTYCNADNRMHKIAQAVQQQWQKAFHIDVILEGLEPKYCNERSIVSIIRYPWAAGLRIFPIR